MNKLLEVLRGALAALAGFVTMAGVAATALALSGMSVTWPFVGAVLSAALGGSAGLTGTLDGGRVAATVHGGIDVVPLGVAGPGLLVFCAVFLLLGRRSGRRLTPRSVGAAAAFLAVFAVLRTTGPATVRISGMSLSVRPDASVLGAVVALAVALGIGWALAIAGRTAVAVAASAVGTVIVLGMAAAAIVPRLAGAALLFGPNVVAAALLHASSEVGGPLAARIPAAAGHGWLPAGVGLAVLVVCTAVARFDRIPGGRRQRVVSTGAALALTLAALSAVAGGSARLSVSVFSFDVPVLALSLRPSVLWALAVGAAGGALAGFVGSLAHRRPSAEPGVVAQAGLAQRG